VASALDPSTRPDADRSVTSALVRPKRLYLARRKPALTRDQFRARWRQHGNLAMSFMARQNWENVTAYIHFDPLREASGIAGASDDYDAIGWIRFKDIEARKRHVQFAEARAVLEADEDEFFAARVNTTGMVTFETTLRDGPPTGVTKFCFLKRKHELTPDEFAEHWANRHAPLLLNAVPSVQRYAQNHPLPPEKGGAWSLGCDGVEESWFASLDDLKAAHAASAMKEVDADRRRFVQDCVVVIARQVVLYPSETSNE
jgi:uncharacterized protein (TIGR02118 family)